MKTWMRNQARSVLQTRAWTATSTWIRGGRRGPAAGHEIHGVPVPGAIVAYFGDHADKTYQLAQWIPVLEELNKRHPVVVVFRKVGALRAFKGITKLPLVFVRRFDDLATLYFENDYRLAIYVNNGVTNFQSLSYAPMVHVHVNHGESDKLSMVSNQAKAYDRVFVAGPAAVDRHVRALIDFDETKLVPVGRPQLDIARTPVLPPSKLRTVMYAPTWEGENDSNNYTSVDLYGEAIVTAVLSMPSTRLVYKPHPRIEQSADLRIAEADERIRSLIESATAGGGEHRIAMQGDILAMFDTVDLMVTDISSVGLDFLYLRPECPLVLTDRRTDRDTLVSESPIAAAAPVLDEESILDARNIICAALADDSFREQRACMRSYYFGGGPVGSSTKSFLDAIDQLIQDRSTALSQMIRRGSSMEATD